MNIFALLNLYEVHGSLYTFEFFRPLTHERLGTSLDKALIG
jgi:hypothetical protein